MTRWLLTAVLLATQLTAWSVAPLYVCVASDGSVGMHLGAGSCGCSHDDDDRDCGSNCHCHHHHHAAGLAQHHEHRSVPSLHAVVKDSCGCTHIQISQSQSPTIVAKATVGPECETVLP